MISVHFRTIPAWVEIITVDKIEAKYKMVETHDKLGKNKIDARLIRGINESLKIETYHSNLASDGSRGNWWPSNLLPEIAFLTCFRLTVLNILTLCLPLRAHMSGHVDQYK